MSCSSAGLVPLSGLSAQLKAFLPTLLGQGEYYSTCDVDEALWSDRNWGHDAYTVNYSIVYECGGGLLSSLSMFEQK